uniref:Uncharacterized protein n=1 Tax=Leptobrachium leishanense TaxID=445787 RepID=A0A8C5PFF6_9ANUR
MSDSSLYRLSAPVAQAPLTLSCHRVNGLCLYSWQRPYIIPEATYPPLSVGVNPNSVQRPTDISSELRTVTTAASAKPHFDFTRSIFPHDAAPTTRMINAMPPPPQNDQPYAAPTARMTSPMPPPPPE